jgi:hypothetical protein
VIALARVAAPRDGRSTATRKLITGSGNDPSAFTEEATQITEDPLGLNKTQRRDVQHYLTGLGFDFKDTGKLDETTHTGWLLRRHDRRTVPPLGTGWRRRLAINKCVRKAVRGIAFFVAAMRQSQRSRACADLRT